MVGVLVPRDLQLARAKPADGLVRNMGVLSPRRGHAGLEHAAFQRLFPSAFGNGQETRHRTARPAAPVAELTAPANLLDDFGTRWRINSLTLVSRRYRQCELTYSTASAVLSRRVELLRRT